MLNILLYSTVQHTQQKQKQLWPKKMANIICVTIVSLRLTLTLKIKIRNEIDFIFSKSLQDISIAIIFKGFGIVSDQEIIQLIGLEEFIVDALTPCIYEAHNHQVFTQNQVSNLPSQNLNHF